METEWEGHVVGVFEGYAGGRIFELSDGRRWRQESNTRENVYREAPKARLLWNQSIGTRYLDVEGTSNVVEVKEDRGVGGPYAGAY
jgi:hypothetical protein